MISIRTDRSVRVGSNFLVLGLLQPIAENASVSTLWFGRSAQTFQMYVSESGERRRKSPIIRNFECDNL